MVDAEVFNTRISDTFERFQTAFELLRTEHNPASIKVTRKLDELKIEVLKVGTYSLRPDVQKRCLVLVSPVSGMYTYELEEASGFCFVNDIVIAIIELLKYHNRVLYIDIDIHHGDGVEEAFYTTNRVMTVSFHRYGESFFPGTGDLMDIGCGEGKFFTLNVPLKSFVNDEQFTDVFC